MTTVRISASTRLLCKASSIPFIQLLKMIKPYEKDLSQFGDFDPENPEFNEAQLDFFAQHIYPLPINNLLVLKRQIHLHQ